MDKHLITVRFKEPLLLGRALDAVYAISDGQRFENCNIELSFYDSLFFKVKFPQAGARTPYEQYIPWAAVGTCFVEDNEVVNAQLKTYTPADMTEVAAKRGRPKKVAE